ncbi:TRAP transporter, DctM subunit [uncultured delta proteobacterium]|uniref:TRAP transporter, DctM subunit n=1 Tax=uncultured delta proteobacterium TaxID=34034 RepID=A0A212K2N3_9DELT|nr:TRAP transporter, DctM subunit [uncultured delta proteobacterium]
MHVIFIVLAAALALSVPIGISLALSAISAYAFGVSRIINPAYVYKSMVDGLNSYPLLAVPLFILSGLIMARGGIAKKLFEFFSYFTGRLTAGLPITAVITCMFYGALSGSGPATTAAVGSMVVPYLESMGYERNFAAALVATAGSLGVIIPPSVPFIIFALAANASVGEMFIAGVIPGIIIAACLSVCAYIHCVRRGEDKELLRANYAAIRKIGFWPLLKDSSWALMTPVIILGGIYGGIFTPTEAATVSVVYSLIIGLFVYKTMALKDMPKVLAETARSLAPLLVVIAAATLFGRVLTLLQMPRMVTDIMSGANISPFVLIAAINLILLFAGMLVNVTSAILILTPVLLPIATAIGMDTIHFGMMMVVNLAIGLVTPPVGADLFVACGMFHIPISTLTRYAIPFIIAFLIALALISYIPALSLVFIR